jgi:hypothetical protein
MAISNYSDKEAVLLLIKRKMQALADANSALIAALADPANDRALIQTQLNTGLLKSALLLARYTAIEAGANFIAPTQTEIQNLSNSITGLENAIEQNEHVTTLISHASAIMAMWPFD